MKAEGLLRDAGRLGEKKELEMVVMKFGGTSVADQAAIERLIAIVRAARQVAIQPESTDWRGPIVVVSALGGADGSAARRGGRGRRGRHRRRT